jgi:hypothetical protein
MLVLWETVLCNCLFFCRWSSSLFVVTGRNTLFVQTQTCSVHVHPYQRNSVSHQDRTADAHCVAWRYLSVSLSLFLYRCRLMSLPCRQSSAIAFLFVLVVAFVRVVFVVVIVVVVIVVVVVLLIKQMDSSD